MIPEIHGNDLMEKTIAGLDAAKDLKPGESKILESSWGTYGGVPITKELKRKLVGGGPLPPDSPPTTTKENIEQANFWAQIGWAGIENDADRNMDLVPDRFDKCLENGCPECKSVWTEIVAIGFTSERTHSGDAWWSGRHFEVLTKRFHHIGDRAVRVQCSEGHAFDFDSYSGRSRKYEVPRWEVVRLPGIGTIAYVYTAKATQSGMF